jgi:O-antigen ligase
MFMLSKFGLIGTVLFIWFYYKISKLSWLVWKNGDSAKPRAKGLICFLILLSTFFMCQSTPFLQNRIDAFFLSLVMGYTYCLYRFHVAQKAAEPVVAHEHGLQMFLEPAYGRYGVWSAR